MRSLRCHALTVALALSVATVAVPACAAAAIDETAVTALEPGGYIWADAAAPAGPVTVVVSIASQRAFVYRGGRVIGVAAVSTGAPGHDTPTGDFTILQKQVSHKSNLYNEAPMPFMQRLTWDGIAIHGGRDPGYPDSHGCVRVPTAFAKKLFGMTQLGAKVTVTDEPIDLPEAGAAADMTLAQETPVTPADAAPAPVALAAAP